MRHNRTFCQICYQNLIQGHHNLFPVAFTIKTFRLYLFFINERIDIGLHIKIPFLSFPITGGNKTSGDPDRTPTLRGCWYPSRRNVAKRGAHAGHSRDA